MNAPRITPALLAKYDRPGPRYTSYPTVPTWRGDFDAAAYQQALDKAALQTDTPLSLYVHIPFCKSRCAYCGCNVTTTITDDDVARYTACLQRELSLTAQRLGNRRTVAQCHWGGGTPTFLDVSRLQALFEHMADAFVIAPDAEIAIETNPGSVTTEQVRCLRALGFNRISFGVQDLDPQVQAAIQRNQTSENTRTMTALCRELGFRGINFDLIYGLPMQQMEGWTTTIEQVIDMAPDRIAIYSYAHLPQRFDHQAPLDALPRPDAAGKYALFAAARQLLLDAGYTAIGMDHFALPDDELALALPRGALHRNFMGYTVQHAPDQIGIGASAISEAANCYMQNIKETRPYCDAVETGALPVARGMRLSRDDVVRRWVIRRLMCTFNVDASAFQEQFGIPFVRYFQQEMAALEYYVQEGLLTTNSGGIQITPLGSVFIRNICMVFDAYLKNKPNTLFSRTI